MTTKAQVKRALKPLLARTPELALVERTLMLRPVGHIIRAISIDSTRSADLFDVRWAFMHLFEPQTYMFWNWGRSLYFPRKGNWLWSHPDVVPALEEVIETALPRLRSVSSIHDLVDQLPYLWPGAEDDGPQSFESRRWYDTKFYFDLALGDWDGARKFMTERLRYYETAQYPPGKIAAEQRRKNVADACRLLAADDRAGLAAFLHDCEAQTVSALKIEHLWQPSPFPMEE